MGSATEFPSSPPGGLFAWLAASEAAGRPFVLATVTDTGGSTPRLAGAVMGIGVDSQVGTVGGGAFEKRVVDTARALLADPSRGTAVVDVHLVRDLGMCCGGKMAVFLNKTEPAPRLWIFGAGHVGTELAVLGLRAGFAVTVVDERAEWAAPGRFPPTCEVVDAEPGDLLKRRRPGATEYVVVTTHSHALDEQLMLALSEAPPAYVGLIGSRNKWAKFRARLAERGVAPGFLDQVHSPVGLDIGAVTPAEIAFSVTAELIACRRAAHQGEG